MLPKCSGFNPKGPYLSLEKEKKNFCVVFTYSVRRARDIGKFHVAVVQRRLRNVRKKRDRRAKLSFCYLNQRVFLPLSLLSLSSLLNLGPVVVIQEFGYHGNLTSHFSLLTKIIAVS